VDRPERGLTVDTREFEQALHALTDEDLAAFTADLSDSSEDFRHDDNARAAL
jgi:hypothetical protein